MAGGGCPDRFWNSTPRELHAHFRGFHRRAEREHHARAWLAWHTAALPLTKKFPRLDDLTGKKAEKKPQTPAQIEAVFRGWLRGGNQGSGSE